jgi:U3 small nucleolar RNA-associated protein 21
MQKEKKIKCDGVGEVQLVGKKRRNVLFSPFRALGTVCNEVPFDVQGLGKEHFVTTSVGNAFHVYNVCHL